MTKAEMSIEMETLRKELFEKDSSRQNIYEEIKSKVQHWKVRFRIFLRMSRAKTMLRKYSNMLIETKRNANAKQNECIFLLMFIYVVYFLSICYYLCYFYRI